MIWNRIFECMSRNELTAWQTKRLKETVERVYEKVPFYRRKMDELGIKPKDIKSLEDIRHLPMTTKQDLRDNYPFGMFSSPMSEIIRLHASSGTTGKPTVVGYAREDIDLWADVMARTLCSAGATEHDIIQIAYGYGLFTGGLGVHYGAEKLGATAIPVSGGNTQRQIQILQDFGPTLLACTPSYSLFLAEALAERNIHPGDLKLKAAVLGAEPWTENMRTAIEKNLGVKAIDIYGLSEIIGPGVAYECMEQNGLHINEDHFYPEIIDPSTLKVLEPGQHGELVFTTITKQGMPLLRYRTRDLTSLITETCPCGRTTVRMHKCQGRSDDMLIIRGVNVFPSQIESVLLEMDGTRPHYLLIIDRVNNLDQLTLQVEVDAQFFSDEIKQLEALSRRIKHNVESTLGLSVNVRLVEPQTIERSEGKAKRVIDNRKLS
ncbi:MAG: phenylacetate--CoA ligase family protein [Kiritimatiellia bacterium]